MVFPPCDGSFTGVPTGPTSATFVPPTLIPTPACAFGPASSADSAACQQQVIAANLANLARNNQANLDVFLADCNNNWAINDEQFVRLGLPRPANDCAARPFGQTLPGTTGSATQSQIPPTFLDSPASGGAIPVGGTALAFTNITSGDNSNFRVGDRWQIRISGAPPNAPVSVNGGVNGENASSQMGSTDPSGNFTLNGQMTQDQVGNWAEAWRVDNQVVGTFRFTVSPSGSVVQTALPPASSGGAIPPASQHPAGGASQSVSDLFSSTGALGGSVSVGGSSVPMWALLGGALLVVVMVVKK